MSWLDEDRVMAQARKTVGPGYAWMGGRFGQLFYKAIRWVAAIIAVIGLGLWLTHPKPHSKSPKNSHIDNSAGAF